ncbi:CoA protein activase [Clostridium sp. MSJ-11]|uniref:CoA protein activase n=1 Tax=Clostridium mobile TaxID=2841512 RepID=A0ABS6ED48_9CLOT|nr:CoA protein activase [Clostridium mobile]MBU5483123.1 CoA protein activase [Clostridium mobile]
MKITFPHMGNLYAGLKGVFEDLGVEVICPPKCSKTTLEIGTKNSPEQICIPFKITLGNYIESIAMGADTLFMWGGCDACRIGFYNTLHKLILKDLGYDIELICVKQLNSPERIKTFLEQLKRVSGNASYFKLISLFKKGVDLIYKIETLDELALKVRPREINKGSVDHLYDRFEEEIYKVKGCDETSKLIENYIDELKSIPINKNKECLKIGIVGEIYTVVEPFINFNIVKKLGNLGVEVDMAVTTGRFLKEQIDFLPFVKSKKKEIHKAAAPYINLEIGGHARHTVGETILYSKSNYDGVIHLLPFTCMPEIVAQSILPTVEKNHNMPILKLVLDEMTGEAGYLTRLEAFVDLLNTRKKIV